MLLTRAGLFLLTIVLLATACGATPTATDVAVSPDTGNGGESGFAVDEDAVKNDTAIDDEPAPAEPIATTEPLDPPSDPDEQPEDADEQPEDPTASDSGEAPAPLPEPTIADGQRLDDSDQPGQPPAATPEPPRPDDGDDEMADNAQGETPPFDPDTPVTQPVEPAAPDDGAMADEGGWQPINPRFDLFDPRPVDPEEFAMVDASTVALRFWGGVEPCFGASYEVIEDSATVQVSLLVGAPPEAASIGCIALAVAYEMLVPLQQPLGDRELVITPGVAFEPDPGPPADAVFAVDYYVGLTLAEAEDLAAVEGRILRIARLDGEWFALTEDFDPSRINVEVDNGIVTAAEGW